MRPLTCHSVPNPSVLLPSSRSSTDSSWMDEILRCFGISWWACSSDVSRNLVPAYTLLHGNCDYHDSSMFTWQLSLTKLTISPVFSCCNTMDCSLSAPLPWNSRGQNTGVGIHSLLQGTLPTQGLNPGLLHCRQILYQLSHKRSPMNIRFFFICLCLV